MLSPLQCGLLVESLKEGGRDLYVVQHVFKVRGSLEIAAFERAWQAMVNRYDILRTGFSWRGLEEPRQIVYPELTVPLHLLDWQRSAIDHATALDALLWTDRENGFDLEEPPLIRATLVLLAREEYFLLLTSHHLVLDGWSKRNILQEWLDTYSALAKGRSPAHQPLVQYREYIDWLARQDDAAASRAWRTALEGKPGSLMFRAGPKDAPKSHCEMAIRVDDGLDTAIRRFAREQRVTVASTISVAIAFFLYKRTGSRSIRFGTTVSTRPAELEEPESAVGLFVNTVPVQAQLDDDIQVAALVRKFQSSQAGLRNWAHVPLLDIQKWSGQQHVPLFDVLLVIENYPDSVIDVSDRESITLELHRLVAKTEFPLSIVAFPSAPLNLLLRYWDDQLDDLQAKQVGESIIGSLSALVEHPDKRIGELGIFEVKNREPRATSVKGSVSQDVSRRMPATATEAAVAVVWSDVLGIPDIAASDNFFDLDGHSLLAMRVIARLERMGYSDIPLQLLFDTPVLADFAAAVATLPPAS